MFSWSKYRQVNLELRQGQMTDEESKDVFRVYG